MGPGEAIELMVDITRGEEAEIGFVLARRFRRVHAMLGLVRADMATFHPAFVAEEASWTRLQEVEVETFAAHEVGLMFGVSPLWAAVMVDEAVHLVEALPRTLAALETGVLDLGRVRRVVNATRSEDLSAEGVQQVEDAALAGAGTGPWEGPTFQTFKARVRRAVLRVRKRTAEAEAASVAERTGIRVDLDPDQPGLATLSVCGPTQDILWLSRTLYDLADRRPGTDPRGDRVSTGRRQVAALFELVERAVNGEDTGSAAGDTPARPEPVRSRELGLVLHADTFFGRGPAAEDPGEIRGFGVPVPVDAGTARAQAIRAAKSGTPTCVLLAGADGTLQRLVRVGATPDTGWTRSTLNEAVCRALAKSAANGGAGGGAALATDRYTPTTAIADHVRAYYPTCTSPTCNRSSRSCDLDHDEPWPRGPTSTTNLNPKSRRCHRWKTLGLWRSRMHPDGSITWSTLTGTVTVKPEPLPGYGYAEGHSITPRGQGQPDTPAA